MVQYAPFCDIKQAVGEIVAMACKRFIGFKLDEDVDRKKFTVSNEI
jgi:hypothetical protein